MKMRVLDAVALFVFLALAVFFLGIALPWTAQLNWAERQHLSAPPPPEFPGSRLMVPIPTVVRQAVKEVQAGPLTLNVDGLQADDYGDVQGCINIVTALPRGGSCLLRGRTYAISHTLDLSNGGRLYLGGSPSGATIIVDR